MKTYQFTNTIDPRAKERDILEAVARLHEAGRTPHGVEMHGSVHLELTKLMFAQPMAKKDLGFFKWALTKLGLMKVKHRAASRVQAGVSLSRFITYYGPIDVYQNNTLPKQVFVMLEGSEESYSCYR